MAQAYMTFTLENREEVTYPYEDTLVTSTVLSNHQIHKVLVDDGSSVNILSRDVMSQIGINPSRMTHIKTLLIGIEESRVLIKGVLEIPIIIGTYLKCLTLQPTFILSWHARRRTVSFTLGSRGFWMYWDKS